MFEGVGFCGTQNLRHLSYSCVSCKLGDHEFQQGASEPKLAFDIRHYVRNTDPRCEYFEIVDRRSDDRNRKTVGKTLAIWASTPDRKNAVNLVHRTLPISGMERPPD